KHRKRRFRHIAQHERARRGSGKPAKLGLRSNAFMPRRRAVGPKLDGFLLRHDDLPTSERTLGCLQAEGQGVRPALPLWEGRKFAQQIFGEGARRLWRLPLPEKCFAFFDPPTRGGSIMDHYLPGPMAPAKSVSWP